MIRTAKKRKLESPLTYVLCPMGCNTTSYLHYCMHDEGHLKREERLAMSATILISFIDTNFIRQGKITPSTLAGQIVGLRDFVI
jgi:hypothetical protein